MLKEEGYKHTNGVSKPEEYLPGPNNARKGSNWVDITVEKQNGTKIRINTVDTYADGTPTVREINAADSINLKTPNEPNIILIPKEATDEQILSILKQNGVLK